jgi:hypothetical protein
MADTPPKRATDRAYRFATSVIDQQLLRNRMDYVHRLAPWVGGDVLTDLTEI